MLCFWFEMLMWHNLIWWLCLSLIIRSSFDLHLWFWVLSEGPHREPKMATNLLLIFVLIMPGCLLGLCFCLRRHGVNPGVHAAYLHVIVPLLSFLKCPFLMWSTVVLVLGGVWKQALVVYIHSPISSQNNAQHWLEVNCVLLVVDLYVVSLKHPSKYRAIILMNRRDRPPLLPFSPHIMSHCSALDCLLVSWNVLCSLFKNPHFNHSF